MATLTLEQQKAIALATAKAKARQRAEAAPQAQAQAAQPDAISQMFAPYRRFARKGAAHAHEGLIGSIPGLPGDMESLGRLALSQFTNVSRDTVLPTSTETTNMMFGASDDPDVRAGRAVGSIFTPLGAKAGALDDAARIAKQKGAMVQATRAAARVPENQAASYVNRLVTRAGQTPEGLAALPQSQKMAAEELGPVGLGHLGALARREGATAGKLEGDLALRSAQANDRILDAFAQAGVNPQAARGNIEAIVAEGRKQAKPLYESAFNRPGVAVWSPRVQEFLDQPETKAGLARGLQVQRLEAISEGRQFKPSDYSIQGMNEDGSPIIGWATKPGEQGKNIPNLRSMDAIKRGLDAMIEDYRNTTTGRLVLDEKGKALDSFRRSFMQEVDRLAPPDYRAARGVASDYLGAQTAFDQGSKAILNPNLTARQFGDAFSKLSPPDRQAFIGGFANRLFNDAQNGRLNLKSLSTPAVLGKLSVALGPEKTSKFLAAIKAEIDMKASTARLSPNINSPTAHLASAMKEQDAFGATQIPEGALGIGADLLRGRPVSALTKGLAQGGQAIADRFTTGGMPVGVRDEAGRLLSMSPQELGLLLSQRNAVQNSRVIPGGGANVPRIDPRVLAAILSASAASKMGQQ